MYFTLKNVFKLTTLKRCFIHLTFFVYFSALIRSLIKNFALGFLFPLCITMYTFRFNRSLYDIAAGTVVVEA